MTAKREVERKYEVPADFTLPDLTGATGVAVVGEPTEHQLDAMYYDTEGLRLAAHRITLRRRSGGTDAGWHLKRPSGDGDRTETQVPLGSTNPDGPDTAVPDALVVQVQAATNGEPLRPVARIRTRRLERPLRGEDGTVLALVAEDSVDSVALGKEALVQQWREIEVELVDGPPKLLDAIEALLRAGGARAAEVPSKLARALADRYPATETPLVSPDRGSAASAVAAYLREKRDAIVYNDAGVRGGEPDAVHDMRVATRRLRSTLRTFRPVLDRSATEPLRAELRWLGGMLGAVRDGEVMAKRLGAAVAAEPPELVVGPVAARLEQRLSARIAEARRELIAALDGPRYRQLLDSLDEVIEAAGVSVTEQRLRALARKAVRRADRRLAAADRAADRANPDDRTAHLTPPLPSAGSRDAALHEARKAYKRARYAAEALRPLAGKPARRLGRRLTDLQDLLGTYQDTVIAGQLLREYGMRAHLEGENAFTYGLLHARQRCRGQRTLAKLPAVRRRVSRRKVRRWLDG